jgi:hypothetical protein
MKVLSATNEITNIVWPELLEPEGREQNARAKARAEAGGLGVSGGARLNHLYGREDEEDWALYANEPEILPDFDFHNAEEAERQSKVSISEDRRLDH